MKRLVRLSLLLAIAAAGATAHGQDDSAGGAFGGASESTSRGRIQMARPANVPEYHVVRRGDTLWDISGHYLGNAYDWPRIWALNPDIANPHWIYPDAQIRLRGNVDTSGAVAAGGGAAGAGGFQVVSNTPRMGRGSLFLRQRGFLDADALESAGTIVGSPEEHMLLTIQDPIFVQFTDENRHPRPGQDLTIFREIQAEERMADEEGTLVRIAGTVRITAWDQERKVATGTITEALEPIERGLHVADMPRRMEMVSPVPADRTLEARVIATMVQRQAIAEEQYVFVDKGSEDGVRVGFRFQMIRQEDGWRYSRASPHQPLGETVEDVPAPEEYPVMVVGEGMVVDVRPHSATLYMTASSTDIRLHERAVLRQGY